MASHPINPEDYEASAIQKLSEFFGGYARHPQPARMDVELQKIYDLGLLTRPDQRCGVAGALAAVFLMHPEHVPGWRSRWPKLCEMVDRLKPRDIDDEIIHPAQLDYLWMLGLVGGDEYPIERILHLGQRRDAVGDAAVLLVHHYAAMRVPIIIEVMSKAVATTTAVPAPLIPHETIKLLSQMAARDPIWSAAVLYVGWQSSGPMGASIVIATPDGQRPMNFPTKYGGQAIATRAASPTELAEWKRLKAKGDAP